MECLQIKPLSVNKAYTGRRFATADLKQYKKDLFFLLPRISVPAGKLSVEYIFGISEASDGDNCIKAFQDAVANKYGFNDKIIYEWHVVKKLVEVGKEFVEFEISPYTI